MNAVNSETELSRPEEHLLQGHRIAFVGKLGSLNRKEASRLVREHGGTPVDQWDSAVTIAVIGADEIPLDDQAGPLTDELSDAVAQGRCEVWTETQLWEQIGLFDHDVQNKRLYTPAMLAELLDVSVATIRRWHRRGLIVPVREVRRLPYFDFQEVTTARRIAQLIAEGASPAAIENKLVRLAEVVPGVRRPLAQLSVLVEGRDVLLRQGEGLIDSGGQLRIDFEALEQEGDEDESSIVTFSIPSGLGEHASIEPVPITSDALLDHASRLEEEGALDESAEALRSWLMANGPSADVSFQLAELLYRLGDRTAARERYFVAIELNEDYVEARANLGCLLAELGDFELAIAAFRGALRFHPDYPDVHFHLGRTLDEMGRADEATESWRRFLELAPDSPWADEARARVGS